MNLIPTWLSQYYVVYMYSVRVLVYLFRCIERMDITASPGSTFSASTQCLAQTNIPTYE